MAPRALTLREGNAPVGDRLLATFTLAALLHGVLILGLSFDAAAGVDAAAPGLQVLLVSDELPESERNDSATYLAQRTQLGSGNSTDSVTAHNRASPLPVPAQAGVEYGTLLGATANFESEDSLLSTHAPQPRIHYLGEQGAARPNEQPLLLDEQAAEEVVPSDATDDVKLRGPKRDELWISPDARASVVAPYLDAWRRKVERIGTLNYPTAATREGVQASPVIEVRIAANGQLESASIRRSSGFADLDQAALAILKLASPFDPFPAELARERSRLGFAYEWRFVGGRMQTGGMTTAP